jgi:lipoyl(octanoyl) transferase
VPALPVFTSMPRPAALTVRDLGLADYAPTWRKMQAFTDARTWQTPDELWLLQHPPVFTVGRNGNIEHVHDTGDIPVLHVDRGGQVTYHGPGQLVAYALLDLKRRRLGVQSLVRLLEQSVIDLLGDYAVRAGRRDKAPGVYVEGRKIAALGLRVRRGCCYHGISLNVDMDLAPFAMINPCGYPGLGVTRLTDLGIDAPMEAVSARYRHHFKRLLDASADE